MSKNRSSSGSSSLERDGDMIDFAMRIWNKTPSEPYYLLHFLVFFSYIPIRCSAAGVLSPPRSAILLMREIQAVVAFFILTVIKLVRDETWESFIANTFFFAKIFLAAIAFIMDYHLALWYMLAFLVIYILAQQPPYEGSGDLNHLTPLQLEALLTEGNTSRFWLIEFRASSVSSCIRTSSFFPELAITYSNKRVSFGTVDLGLFPNAAEKFGISLGRKFLFLFLKFSGIYGSLKFDSFLLTKRFIRISDTESLNQLPAYILFDNGTEVSCLSEVDLGAKLFSPSLTKKHLCRHFELDKLLLDYVNGR